MRTSHTQSDGQELDFFTNVAQIVTDYFYTPHIIAGYNIKSFEKPMNAVAQFRLGSWILTNFASQIVTGKTKFSM